MGRAFADLSECARDTDPGRAAEEFQELFIGLGRGAVVPFGSFYLTGFLNEKPLAEVRASLRTLGVSRRDTVKEPEDHIGTLMEVMSGLISGAYGAARDLETQRRFFEAHIANWAPHFFRDLEGCGAARLYRPLARIGGLFITIETAAFEME